VYKRQGPYHAERLRLRGGAERRRPDPSAVTGASLGALIYLGTFASVVGFLAYFHMLWHLGPVPLALVFVLFPVVAQLAAFIVGERGLRGGSLALLGLVLAASLMAVTGRCAAAQAVSARTFFNSSWVTFIPRLETVKRIRP
jgi:hypothetical protein